MILTIILCAASAYLGWLARKYGPSLWAYLTERLP